MTGLKDTDKNKEWQFAALLLSVARLAIWNGGGPRTSSHGSLWNYANARFDAAVDAPGAKLSKTVGWVASFQPASEFFLTI